MMKSKICTITILAIIIIFAIQLNVQAVVISSDKQVESDSGTVTVSVTSSQTLGAYTLKLIDTAGLTLTGATGQHVSSDFKTITGSSAEGTKNLGTFTFKVPAVEVDTKYNIKFSITGMETPDLEQVADETNTAIITVNAKQVQTPPSTNPETPPITTPSTPTTEKPKELEFKVVNETVYATGTVNVRKSYSSDAARIGSLSEGDSVTRSGKSTSKADGYYWSKITYNGQTAYVISSKLSTEKPVEETVQEPIQEEPKEELGETFLAGNEEEENIEKTDEIKGLKELKIEGIKLSPEFATYTYKYEAVLRENITKLEINAETLNEDETVVVAGNTNIQEGENLITIVVYNAKNEGVATYQIVVNKNTLDLSSTDELLKYGNQAAKLKITIYMVAIVLTTILLITVLIVRYKTQNKQEQTQFEPQKEEKQERIAIEEKKGKHF